MAFLIIILLGIVQGLTEFLPVSSSGHLVLFYNIFGVENNTLLLSIVLHVATLLAVCTYYFKDLIKLIKKPFCKTNINILIACVPTIILVVIFKKYIENLFQGNYLFIFFIITAVVLFLSDIFSKKNEAIENAQNQNFEDFDITNMKISKLQALIIGCVQGIACVPGISRSGSTIATGIFCKVNREESTNFSFLISIPVIIGSMLVEIYDYIKEPTPLGFSVLQIAIGFVIAFIVGYLCIKFMLNFVKKQKLTYFSIYLIVLSIVLIFLKIYGVM